MKELCFCFLLFLVLGIEVALLAKKALQAFNVCLASAPGFESLSLTSTYCPSYNVIASLRSYLIMIDKVPQPDNLNITLTFFGLLKQGFESLSLTACRTIEKMVADINT